MARLKKPAKQRDWLFPNAVASHEAEDESSLLDVLDNVLNRGAVIEGEVVLGVADVDLIYVKLSVLLAAFDKVTKEPRRHDDAKGKPRRGEGRPRRHEATKKKSSR